MLTGVPAPQSQLPTRRNAAAPCTKGSRAGVLGLGHSADTRPFFLCLAPRLVTLGGEQGGVSLELSVLTCVTSCLPLSVSLSLPTRTAVQQHCCPPRAPLRSLPSGGGVRGASKIWVPCDISTGGRLCCPVGTPRVPGSSAVLPTSAGLRQKLPGWLQLPAITRSNYLLPARGGHLPHPHRVTDLLSLGTSWPSTKPCFLLLKCLERKGPGTAGQEVVSPMFWLFLPSPHTHTTLPQTCFPRAPLRCVP